MTTARAKHLSRWSDETPGRGGRSLERVMHARFADYRAEREWFGSEIVAELLPLLDEDAA